MKQRAAEEAMTDIDVRDLQVQVKPNFAARNLATTFYKEKGEPEG